MPWLSSASSASIVSTRMPENPLASTLARSAIIARTVRGVERRVNAGGVAAQQVHLERWRDRAFATRVSAKLPNPVLMP